MNESIVMYVYIDPCTNDKPWTIMLLFEVLSLLHAWISFSCFASCGSCARQHLIPCRTSKSRGFECSGTMGADLRICALFGDEDDEIEHQRIESSGNNTNLINIIHFNDAYNITPQLQKDKEGNITSIKGGASRFKSFINTLSPLKPVVLFSGDFLSPSSMSTATGGTHMIPIFNELGITCACLGNHELDRGNEHCIEMLSKLNYPTLNCTQWTPTNGKATGNMNEDLKLDLQPLGKCEATYVFPYAPDFNIGFIGLSASWSALIQPANGILYLDYIEECRKQVHELKQRHQIHLMIALTHSRLPEDQLLASQVEGIDLILGGHDHFYHCGMNQDTNTMIVKSGSDFHNVSWLQIQKLSDTKDRFDTDPLTQEIEAGLHKSLHGKKGVFNGKRYKFVHRYYNIDIHIQPDDTMEKLVHDLTNSFEEKVNQTIGYIAGPLDVRKSVVRSRESNAGNFFTDVIRRAYHCDVVVINGSVLRANRIITTGPITTKDLLDIDAFQNTLMVIKMKGSLVLTVLERAFEFGCPQISGMRFIYDDKKEIGHRIKKVWISRYKESHIDTFHKSFQNLKSEKGDECDEDEILELLDEDALYTISVTDFLFHSGLKIKWEEEEDVEVVIDSESGLPLSIILRNFFWAITTVNELFKLSKDKDEERVKSVMDRFAVKPTRGKGSMLRLDHATDDMKINELVISPRMEQRIMTIDQEIDMASDEFGSLHKWFGRLPSFAGLTKLPRQQSLLKILQEVNEMEQAKQ
eukprot:776230_1